ncbi:MAG TPA: hypothetical protein DFS52_03450 [Myxococcales bacterium]|jgi:uncharacterized protein YaiL (DUF2058 family)|nr:hypothetical protein [Myxococcales bacterium]
MQSLKDKLVQAGVVSADYRPGEKAEQRAARLNREQAEKRNQIEQIVKAARIATPLGEHTFFFTTRSKKMRRLVIEEPVRRGLERGDFAVVEFPNQPDFPWAVVPRAAAEKILKIDQVAVRFFVRSETEQYGVAPEPKK